MVYAGANGATREELAATMKYNALADDDSFKSSFRELIEDLNNPSNAYNMSMANRLFGRLGYNFHQEFIQATETYFHSSLEELDFAGDPAGSTETINRWVELQTQDKIQNLIPQGAVNSMTAMVLINAIYFSANWVHQFREDETKVMPFYLSKSEQENMDMMFLEKYLRVGTIPEWKCRILELPYKENGDVSLFVLLPDEIDGLVQLESKVTGEGIEEAIEGMPTRSSLRKLYLPKFKLTLDINMKKVLQAMGIKELFTPHQANLSGMNGGSDLYVTEVVHKAFIDVNEKGTEAAAATGIIIGLTSFQQPIAPFKVDHPAMFFIRDKSTKSLLFLGRLVKPPTNDPKMGAFGQEMDDSSAASNLLRPLLFSVICVLLATVCTL